MKKEGKISVYSEKLGREIEVPYEPENLFPNQKENVGTAPSTPSGNWW